MSLPPVRAVGIPWYTLESYARVLEVMVDRDKLPSTYSQWRLRAEQTERELRRQGQLVVRAHLDPDEFVAWCATRGLDVDSHARIEFANQAALDTHGKTH